MNGLHIECEAGKLLKAVQAVLPAITGKSTLPCLSHILLEAEEENSIRLSGTDLEMGVRVVAGAEVKERGAATAEAKLLAGLLSKLPAASVVSLKATDNERIILSSGKSVYVLGSVSPEEFPPWPQTSTEQSVCLSMNGEELASCIEQTIYAVSTDKARQILNAVLLKVSDGRSTFVSTDTHRLARRYASLLSVTGEGSVILPPGFLSAVKGYLSKEAVSMEFSFRYCWLRSETAKVEIYTKVLEGQYPNFERVIPTSNASQLSFNVEEAKSALQRALLVASDGLTARMILKASGMLLEITAENLGQKATEEIVCAIQGEVPRIGINGKYLLQSLNSLETAEALLLFQENNLRPIVLHPMTENGETDINLLVVLMPMNIDA